MQKIKLKTMKKYKTIDFKMLIIYTNHIFYIYCKKKKKRAKKSVKETDLFAVFHGH